MNGRVKRSVTLTTECYSKVERLSQEMSVPKVSVFAIAIDNLYRARFGGSRAETRPARRRRSRPVRAQEAT